MNLGTADGHVLRRRSFVAGCLLGLAGHSSRAETMDQIATFRKHIEIPISIARIAFLIPAADEELPTVLPDTKLAVYSDGQSRTEVKLVLMGRNIFASEYKVTPDEGGVVVDCKATQETKLLRDVNVNRGFPISGNESRQIIEALRRYVAQAETAFHQTPKSTQLPNHVVGNYGAAFLIASVGLLAGATTPQSFGGGV